MTVRDVAEILSRSRLDEPSELEKCVERAEVLALSMLKVRLALLAGETLTLTLALALALALALTLVSPDLSPRGAPMLCRVQSAERRRLT